MHTCCLVCKTRTNEDARGRRERKRFPRGAHRTKIYVEGTEPTEPEGQRSCRLQREGKSREGGREAVDHSHFKRCTTLASSLLAILAV